MLDDDPTAEWFDGCFIASFICLFMGEVRSTLYSVVW